MNLVERARKFAKEAHSSINQKRKYTDDPYIVHPASVAKIVSTVTDDPEMIAAAWLHDVVEDTGVSITLVREEFGQAVADLVSELTDVSKPSDGNRKVRKSIDLNHTKTASNRAKTVKLADLIDNSRSIVQHDPGFARVYMQEKKNLLQVLKEGDPQLYKQAKQIVDDYYRGS